MKLLKYLVYATSLVLMSVGLLTVDSSEPTTKNVPVNSDAVKNPNIKKPSVISPVEANKLRKELLQHRIEHSDYMRVLKEYRVKARDMQLVQSPNKARAKTNLRSQNHAWTGTYDCNDADASVKPGQVEVCDGIDNNCNGDVDEGVTADLFLDADGDGWGDPSKTVKACHLERGFASRGGDCDDRNIQIYPGAADTVGDGIDANCDGKDG